MKNNNILMFSIFGIAIIYMCMSGIKVYASEETNSITDGSYTVTIPSEVQIPSGSNSNSFDVTCDKIYIDDSVTVKVDKKSGNLTNMNGSATIPYAISINNDQSSNVMIFTSNKTTNKINVQLSGTGNIAGTYTDTLTFDISSVKQKYSLNIRGYLEGNSMSNIGEIADITVTGINDSASNSLQYSNVNSTTKYIINVSIKDSSKYVLSEVKNDGKNDVSTGFTWNKDTNTITGIVAGDYATNGIVYVDLYFVRQTHTLTFDVNDGQFSNESNETKQKTYQVKYGEPLTQIDSEDLKLGLTDTLVTS